MRTAIRTQLITITEIGDRWYQPYSAPSDATKPYGVIKLSSEDPAYNNKKGSFMGLQIFLYGSKSTFSILDIIELKVKQKLHLITLITDDSPARFFRPEYLRTIGDSLDDNAGLFMKRMDFIIPLSRA